MNELEKAEEQLELAARTFAAYYLMDDYAEDQREELRRAARAFVAIDKTWSNDGMTEPTCPDSEGNDG